jgi:2-polyprenyl-3-methyl-5-hydroxy-6-metoxy-1,4-benzoquinol methylase
MYCAACALGQLAPLPTDAELATLYDSPGYYEGDDTVGYAGYAADAPQLRRTFASKLAWLARSGPLDALAEIGCGPGYLLQVAREAGIRELVGVDHNPWAVEQVRAAGIAAHRGSVEALPAGRRYDAIAMLDLLEHVPAPVPFLREVATRLKPGGRLLVMTPNIRSLLARLSGRRWVSFKVPEHVVYYSPKSIRLTLARAGFEATAIRSATQYVTVAFALDRFARLVPGARAISAALRPLGLERRVIPVTNGSIDVIARLAAG